MLKSDINPHKTKCQIFIVYNMFMKSFESRKSHDITNFTLTSFVGLFIAFLFTSKVLGGAVKIQKKQRFFFFLSFLFSVLCKENFLLKEKFRNEIDL